MDTWPACGAPDCIFFDGEAAYEGAGIGGPREVWERSSQVKAREVSSLKVVIMLRWAWREGGIVDAAHPAKTLLVDIVRPRARANWGGAPVVNVGRW